MKEREFINCFHPLHFRVILDNVKLLLRICGMLCGLLSAALTLQAGSATWNLNPVDNNWITSANWTPTTVPYGETDVATFGASNTTEITLGDSPNGEDASNLVGSIVFNAGARPYTFTITPMYDTEFPSLLVIYQSITNNSGVIQNFVTANSGTAKASGRLYFDASGYAGERVTVTNQGGAWNAPDGMYGGFTQFWATSNAGKATFINNGGTVSGAEGGVTDLLFDCIAESATFINNPGVVSGAYAGFTLVQTTGNIGSSTFIANPATVPDAEGGWVETDYGTSDGATFIANGATVANCQAGQIYAYGLSGYATYTGKGGRGTGSEGGLIDIFSLPASDQTIVTANGGTNGGLGGTILIEYSADIPLPQFQVFGNGVLDLTNVTDPTMPIGSLAGNGMVLLAGHSLSIGNNNLSSTFSGVLQESGGLNKAGTGTLTLAGANTYTGTTTVAAGTLRVNNATGSGTGSGPVKVEAGTLGGKGTIAGPVTIGTSSGTGAVLAPSVGVGQLAILTLQQGLTFKADGSYSCKLNTNNTRADQVVANRMNIRSGAQFSFQSLGNRRLPIGTIFTAMSNTSTNPITGTFANLPDNSTFTVGRNNFQVSYSGGDGNDLS